MLPLPLIVTIITSAVLVSAARSLPAEQAPDPLQETSKLAERSKMEKEASLTLDAAVVRALAESPGLAQLRARAEALGARPSQVGSLPDPTLGLNALNLPTDSFALDQEPMTQLQILITQAVPFPGKLGLKRAAAQFDAEAAAIRVEERQLELVADVRSAWWRLFYLERALEIVDQNQVLMREFNKIAQTQYKVGKGLQQDVLLAQLELSRLLDKELKFQGLRQAQRAELNALLNRPVETTVRLSLTPANDKLPKLPGKSELLQRAQKERPLLAVRRHQIEAARSRLEFARKDYYPDFRLGAGYGFRQGKDPLRGVERPDFFTTMLSVNVPIYFRSKQGKAVDQRTSELFEQKFTLHDTLRSVQAAIARNLAAYEAAREQVLLLRTGIIPQAEQTVSAMLSAYRVGKVDFLNVINTEITRYNAQIDYWQALSEAKQALAKLAAEVGVEALYE